MISLSNSGILLEWIRVYSHLETLSHVKGTEYLSSCNENKIQGNLEKKNGLYDISYEVLTNACSSRIIFLKEFFRSLATI